MKKLLYLLLLPLSSFAQVSVTNLNLEADTIRLETRAGRNTAARVGRMYKNIIASYPNLLGSYSLVAGTNISITGTWPNQTINQSGGAGITNSAPSNHLMASDGVNAIDAGIVKSGFSGSVTLGASAGVWNFSGGVYVAPSSFPNTGATGTFQANQVNASTNTVMYPGAFSRGLTSGTAAAGIGAGIKLITVNNAGSYVTGSTVESVETTTTAGSENFDLVLKNTSTGVGLQEIFRVKSNGAITSPLHSIWTSISMPSGWSTGIGNAPQYMIDAFGAVHLRGSISVNAGSSVSGAALVPTSVSGSRHQFNRPYSAHGGGPWLGYVWVEIQDDGSIDFLRVPDWSNPASIDMSIYLDGIVYWPN